MYRSSSMWLWPAMEHLWYSRDQYKKNYPNILYRSTTNVIFLKNLFIFFLPEDFNLDFTFCNNAERMGFFYCFFFSFSFLEIHILDFTFRNYADCVNWLMYDVHNIIVLKVLTVLYLFTLWYACMYDILTALFFEFLIFNSFFFSGVFKESVYIWILYDFDTLLNYWYIINVWF